MEDLGRLRVLAGRMGLPQGLWSHLDPETEAERLLEYCHAVLDTIETSPNMTFDDYQRIVAGLPDDPDANVVAFSPRPRPI